MSRLALLAAVAVGCSPGGEPADAGRDAPTAIDGGHDALLRVDGGHDAPLGLDAHAIDAAEDAPRELDAMDASVALDGSVDAAGSDASVADAGRCFWPSASGCDDPVEVRAGSFHVCARRASGRVVCWGSNLYGGLGTGDPLGPRRLRPGTAVVGLGAASGLDTGTSYACALVAGEAWCWGANSYAELGVPTPMESATPLRSSAPPLTALTTGIFTTCGLTPAGGVLCWGANIDGAIGGGPGLGMFDTPPTTVVTAAGPLTGVDRIAAGAAFACARAGSAAWCWGSNSYGQLGTGMPRTISPVAVRPIDGTGAPLDDVVDVSAGGHLACAVRAGGAVWCWGLNQYGEVGDGTMIERAVATPVLDAATGLPLTGAVAVSAGSLVACALLSSGEVRCWGGAGFCGDGDASDTTPRTRAVAVAGIDGVGRLGGVTQLTVGRFNSCALGSFGVACWGDGADGQLGDGMGTSSLVPRRVLPPPD